MRFGLTTEKFADEIHYAKDRMQYLIFHNFLPLDSLEFHQLFVILRIS